MDTTERTEADTLAGIIRAGAAWWNLAADALAEGDHNQAARYATLGDLGTSDMRDRLATMATAEVAPAY